MWRSKDNEEVKLEPVKCPVCSVILGTRDKTTIFMAHCEECRATFYWRPGTTKPTVQMDRDIEKKCGCNGCGR